MRRIWGSSSMTSTVSAVAAGTVGDSDDGTVRDRFAKLRER